MELRNIPEVKLGVIAVSRSCFPAALSERRRAALKAAYGEGLYECPVTVENEVQAKEAVRDVKASGVNALVVFLGNFGPETPETLIAQWFHGPIMYVAAAEGDGDLHDGRGDAYCGMLNCSYNLGLRGKTAYIPEYPVGTAEELAEKIREFEPIARAILGLKGLKLITFGPRPDDFLACNGPIKALYDLGVAVEENSELDLLVAYNKHAGDERIPAKIAEMEAELGGNNPYGGILPRLAQYELTLLDWAEEHKGTRQYVAFANKCWPAFQTEFKFVPCYVNSRLAARGIPVSCEVDIYGALSEYIGVCVSGAPTTAVVSLATNRDVYVVELDDEHIEKLTAASPYYSKNVIPAAAYGLEHDATTVAVGAVIIARDDVGDDAVYDVVSGIFDSIDTLGHDKKSELSLGFAASVTAVPYHPGAAKYFSEKGFDVPSK